MKMLKRQYIYKRQRTAIKEKVKSAQRKWALKRQYTENRFKRKVQI